MIIAAWSVIITKLIILKAVRPRDDFIGEFKYYLPLSMNNENKVDRIGVQLQNESLSFSFVSTFYLGCRFYVIDHAITRSRRSSNMTQHVVACMTGALWAKWTQEISALQEKVNGCRVGEILWAWSWGWAQAGPCGKRGKGQLSSFVVCWISASVKKWNRRHSMVYFSLFMLWPLFWLKLQHLGTM